MTVGVPQVGEPRPRRAPGSVFEASTDFTIGLEEEFALVDPDSLELAHRFEELRDAAHGRRRCSPSRSPAS